MIKRFSVMAALAQGACGSVIGTPNSDGVDAEVVTMGTLLPFGVIAANCEATPAQMGEKVDANAGYALYDSDPSKTGLRTHYLTGFRDDCARQFTAATALMSDVGTHEVVRYLQSNAKTPYNVTDSAYETIKNAFCRVRRGQPCGAKLDRLAKAMAFVTVYEKFGENPTWSNILLNKGEVIAMGPAES